MVTEEWKIKNITKEHILKAIDKIKVFIAPINVTKDFEIKVPLRKIAVPINSIEEDMQDKGTYLLLIKTLQI